MEKFDTLSFTENFSAKIVELAEKNPRIAAVTAAMAKGTGLDAFSRRFKNRFFDVGIAEEHAVTFAGGLSAGGMIPVTAIYSTFIQRSVDQIIEDIALQNRHAVFVLDRAGAVPGDGETHQGIFDIALFKSVPNLTILSVAGKSDMDLCLDFAVNRADCPVIIRWPKMTCPSEMESFSHPVEIGRGILLKGDEFAPSISFQGGRKKILLVCTGGIFSETLIAARSLILEGFSADIFSLRFIKPFDEKFFTGIAENYDAVIFVEDGVKKGGIGRDLENILLKGAEKKICTEVLGFPDSFVANGNRAQILEEAGLSPEKIVFASKELLK
jgi:1-deoxy-D-xylulose-5-phosphate synthase